MSNETPVTLTDCIEWLLSCQFESAHKINLKNKDAQAYISAILSHLRASAAKLPEGFVDISEHIAEMCKDPEYAARHLAARERLRAAPGEAKCKNDECEDGQVPDPEACWKPCPDCAPSPEQATVTVTVTDQDGNAEQHVWPVTAEQSQQGAEQLPNAEDCAKWCEHTIRFGTDHTAGAWLARSAALLRQLSVTAPAPAVGLTQDEREALTTGAMIMEDIARHGTTHERAKGERMASALRSLLERGGK
jgi:hypothetical protein